MVDIIYWLTAIEDPANYMSKDGTLKKGPFSNSIIISK